MTTSDALLGWREHWELKFPNLEPPKPITMLASPLSVDVETITVVTFSCIINKWRTFIISQINHNLCLCTQVDLNVCANSNISGGPPASTCVYQFFYEYEKNCKGTQLPILKDGTSHDMQTTMLNKNQQTMQRINDSHLKENESRPSFILKQEDMYKPTIKTFFHPHQLVVGDQISFPLISNNFLNL